MQEAVISESNKSKLFLIPESKWGTPVIKKVLNLDFPEPEKVRQFYNEYETTKDLDIPGIRKALEKLKENNKHEIILEYFKGKPISEVFSPDNFDLTFFLETAIVICGTLSELHSFNIIHKDLNPNNILMNQDTREVKIIDFGISTKIDMKSSNLGNPEKLEGTLNYISPEQTGRMNRVVDYRTDIYSLGVTFYELLAGQLPFISNDAMDLVHCHIAKKPTALSEVNPEIPQVLSDIVDMMLAKTAEERYQSAFGIQVDIENCLDQLMTTGMIDPFEIGQDDYSGRFTIPQKLYGREEEVNTLMHAFDRVSRGAVELMLVGGYSGTGKTALVHEIHKPITEKRGYFIQGKFDQYQRNIPYFGIIQAFKEFVNLLLMENKEELELLRTKIQSAVGAEGKVLTDMIPNLEVIIGKQPQVPEIGGKEAQNRFNYVFQNFIRSISKKEHPIVLFIDDLQWADAASLELLKVIMSDDGNGYLLCICAYRNNEVDPSHPFMQTVGYIREEKATVNEIEVKNLSPQNIHQLISEALLKEERETAALKDLVYEKTQGNAFFTIQFLKSLNEEELLSFNFRLHKWQWNLMKVKQANMTDNVVELMTKAILKLSDESQQALKFASCIGNQFDLPSLAVIYSKTEEETREHLEPALMERFIEGVRGNQFRFAHDRIQQAVYSLIPNKDKESVHLKIGKILLEKIPEKDRGGRIFDIVNQWNWGIKILINADEKNVLAELNLQAGQKAMSSSAYEPAFNYFEKGIELLTDEHWSTHYDMCLALHVGATDAASMVDKLDEMESYGDKVIAHAVHHRDKGKVIEVKIQSYVAQNRPLEAISIACDFLKELGVNLPKDPDEAAMGQEVAITNKFLEGKNVEEFVNLPEMTDPDKILAIEIMASIIAACYVAHPVLLIVNTLQMVVLSVTYGNSPVSCVAYSVYGLILTNVFGDIETGYKYGLLCVTLADRPESVNAKSKAYELAYAQVHHWKEHLMDVVEPLMVGYRAGMEVGDIEWALYCITVANQHRLMSGKELPLLQPEIDAGLGVVKKHKHGVAFAALAPFTQSVYNLLTVSDRPWEFNGPHYNEAEMIPDYLEAKFDMAIINFYTNKIFLSYLFGRFENTVENSTFAEPYLQAALGKVDIGQFYFYDSLGRMAIYRDASLEDQKKYLEKVEENQAKLKNWANHAPMNYTNKYLLVEAEHHRAIGENEKAEELYQDSIKSAEENQFLHEEAIAFEMAARHYQAVDNIAKAKEMMQNAYKAFRQWGAASKLKDLEMKFATLLSGMDEEEGLLEETSTVSRSIVSGTTSDSGVLDLSTVMKASTVISGEIKLSLLLQKMMTIAIENAGAQKGVMLLDKKGKLLIEARSGKDKSDITVLQATPMEGSGKVPEMIVNYVARTKETLVLENAENDNRFTNDPYLPVSHPKSVLCLPILNQGILTGVLYLENNLATGAFSPRRVEVLTILSGQIAISIQNALLVENLEQKVAERTEQIVLEKRKSDDLLLNILPEETAEELKKNGRAIPRGYKSVTVMFTDFKGFTQISEKLSPTQLVEEINTLFGAFDRIVKKHGVEKIKTIGDAYMCAGGLPMVNTTHPKDVVAAALEINAYMDQHKKEKMIKGEQSFEIRLGVHTGPVVSGVVGYTKFAYDIWGDTVNTASRMESSGTPGKVNVSGTTYELIKEDFNCHHRGKIQAKNKGEIDMYFVESAKSDQFEPKPS